MSERSEQFKEATVQIGVRPDENGEVTAEKREYIKNVGSYVPPVAAFTEAYNNMAIWNLRRVYRRWAGHEFTSPADAIEKTANDVAQEIVPLMFEAYSAGILMGEKQLPVVCECKEDNAAWIDLAKNEEFRLVAVQQANELADPDMVTEFHRFVRDGIGQFSELIHLDQMPMELIHKIWEIWWIATKTCCSSLFAAGYEVGRKAYTSFVLDGILSVTEEGQEES